jgi:hypothetical protein
MKLDVFDVLLVLGVILIYTGVAMIHIPTSVIVAGVLLIGLALLSSGRQRR